MKKINTIGIRFTKGVQSEEIIEKIIEDKLGIPFHELAGLAYYGPKRHKVRVLS